MSLDWEWVIEEPSAAQIRTENALKHNEYVAIFVVGAVGETKSTFVWKWSAYDFPARKKQGHHNHFFGWSWRICTMQDLTCTA